MYKLLNKLFGWDYIAWRNTAESGIARLHKDNAGTVFYWRYKGSRISDKVVTRGQVLWLTCTPDKWGIK